MNYLLINAQLPTLNDYTKANRSHWSNGAKFKQNIETLIGYSIIKCKADKSLYPIENPCEIFIYWHEKTKRRDVDNIQSAQKFILDALQRHQIIVNDNRKYVKQIRHEVIDDESDYVEVILKETEKNG